MAGNRFPWIWCSTSSRGPDPLQFLCSPRAAVNAALIPPPQWNAFMVIPMYLPWSAQPKWRGHYGLDGKWISEWPGGMCKECGAQVEGDPSRRYCSSVCKKRAHTRSSNHAGRTQKSARKQGRAHSAYEIIGKFELHDAFEGRCAIWGGDPRRFARAPGTGSSLVETDDPRNEARRCATPATICHLVCRAARHHRRHQRDITRRSRRFRRSAELANRRCRRRIRPSRSRPCR